MNQIPNEAASDVTQADRDAAFAICETLCTVAWTGDEMREGKVDNHEYVQAFARHRIAATRKHDPSPLVEALEVIAVGEGCMNGIREELSASALRNIARRVLAEASQ